MRPAMGNAVPGLAGGVHEGAAAKRQPAAARRAARCIRPRSSTRWATSPRNKVYAWTPDDYKVSEVMQGYFANFVKTGDPNGPGLPTWPAANRGDRRPGHAPRRDTRRPNRSSIGIATCSWTRST